MCSHLLLSLVLTVTIRTGTYAFSCDGEAWNAALTGNAGSAGPAQGGIRRDVDEECQSKCVEQAEGVKAGIVGKEAVPDLVNCDSSECCHDHER